MSESIFWSYFSYRDILDIVIVAFLIYQLIAVVKGTRAVQMLLGLGLLGGLFGLSIYYHLNALNWLLRKFFDSLFILLIVLFQDQIRAALASFGTGRRFLFWRKKRYQNENIYSELSQVVEKLSKEQVGALIVLECTHGLKSYVSTGTFLDTAVNAELLFAIFQSTSDLHDGAVILSEEKIAAAGCFLPLSRNPNLDQSFGTRHRAALGISEESDALAIVVSEESGEVRIAQEGRFVEVKKASELIVQLESLTLG